MYESIIVFRAKRDPLRDAAHSCKSSIGRMKRVIRYVHSIYNDASIFRESRFLSLLWFRENNTPPPLESRFACASTYFFFLFPRSRDRFRERGSARHANRFARKRNVRDCFTADYRTFPGERNSEIARASRSENTFRRSFSRADREENDRLYCTQ